MKAHINKTEMLYLSENGISLKGFFKLVCFSTLLRIDSCFPAGCCEGTSYCVHDCFFLVFFFP